MCSHPQRANVLLRFGEHGLMLLLLSHNLRMQPRAGVAVMGALARVHCVQVAADAIEGDILYISDSRWWLGGLKSGHGRISAIDADDDGITVHLGPGVRARIIVPGREAEPLKVKRLY